ncbi:MAG: PEP-CTERM sorting domain-containing protein [Gammaproteobacteria bacterium]
MKRLFLFAGLMLLIPQQASANIPIPEPGILPLLAVGGIVGLVAYLKRRK